MVATLLFCLCERGKGPPNRLPRDRVGTMPIPSTAARKLHLGSHSGLRGDAAREIASNEDGAKMRKQKSKRGYARCASTGSRNYRASKDSKGQSLAENTEHHRSCPNPYTRPCGDTAHTADSEGTICVCGSKTKFQTTQRMGLRRRL